MPVGVLTFVAALATSAAVAAAGAPSPAPSPVTPFGGPVAVHIARIGHIDLDTGPASGAGLRRIACAGAPPTTSCFVSR
jgi:hypothetical protein